ncbi:hypothetical protein B0H19DRAFT_1252389 [Mycena capillaripes]|nr:hypothetical protein B0H19DRAFT_1252389 [Mycena capillaripes]
MLLCLPSPIFGRNTHSVLSRPRHPVGALCASQKARRVSSSTSHDGPPSLHAPLAPPLLRAPGPRCAAAQRTPCATTISDPGCHLQHQNTARGVPRASVPTPTAPDGLRACNVAVNALAFSTLCLAHTLDTTPAHTFVPSRATSRARSMRRWHPRSLPIIAPRGTPQFAIRTPSAVPSASGERFPSATSPPWPICAVRPCPPAQRRSATCSTTHPPPSLAI